MDVLKVIVIIDKPNSCIECPCSNFDKQNVCEILVRPIDDETHGLDGKPDWCPLIELPNKEPRSIIFDEYEDGWADGFNYLRGVILGEADEDE